MDPKILTISADRLQASDIMLTDFTHRQMEEKNRMEEDEKKAIFHNLFKNHCRVNNSIEDGRTINQKRKSTFEDGSNLKM